MDDHVQPFTILGNTPQIRLKRLALIGIVLLLIGVFLPIYQEDTDTSRFFDYADNNKIPADGFGVPIFIFAGVSLLLLLMDRAEYLSLPVIILFWLLFLQFMSIWLLVQNDRYDATLQYGWAVLGIGLLLLSLPGWWPAQLDLRRVFVVAGLLMLLIGFLVPIASFGEDGSVYFSTGRYGGGNSAVFYMFPVACVLLVLRREDKLWIFGLLALALLINDFRIVWQGIHGGNAGFILWSKESGKLGWAWMPLFWGSILLSLTLFLGEDREKLLALSPYIPLDDEEETTNEEEPESIDADTAEG